MTVQEIRNAFLNDYEQVLYRMVKIDLRKYERVLKKNKAKGSMMFEPIVFKSKNLNEYVIQLSSSGLKEIRRSGPRFKIYLIYQRPEGYYAALNLESNVTNPNFYIFPPHFFQRYQERFLHQPELSQRETIMAFFQNKNTLAFQSELDEDGEFISVFKDGYMLGNAIDDDVVIMKTYLNFDMLKGEQIKLKERLDRMLDRFIQQEFREVA